MGPINDSVKKVHKILNTNTNTNTEQKQQQSQLNNAEQLTNAFLSAFKNYGNPNAIIVKVDQKCKNQYDHLFAVEALSNHNISYESYSFQELIDLGSFDEDTGVFKV